MNVSKQRVIGFSNDTKVLIVHWFDFTFVLNNSLEPLSTIEGYKIKNRIERYPDRVGYIVEVLYNTNFSRGGNVRYIRELGFCAKFSCRENNIHCEWNFAKFSSREIYLPRNVPPRDNNILIAPFLLHILEACAFVHRVYYK